MPMIWINGQLVPDSQATVSVRDTGLLHGAGVFTTMRAYEGTVFRLGQHLARLRRSCEHLHIPLHYKDPQLATAVQQLLQSMNLSSARLRITVTRGAASEDPLHGQHFEPTVFITAVELAPYPPEYYQRGLAAIVLDEQKLNPYDLQAGYKTLNYFSRLAALRTASLRGAGEALWFNVHNYLQSGSISNVFVVKDGKLLTPPTPLELQDSALAGRVPYPRSNVLDGITRQAVLELADELAIDVALAALNIGQLLEAQEVFLTNSIMQIIPVSAIERKAVGQQIPGPLTGQLMAALDQLIEVETGQ